jgi:uncharacterized DUF497 family protein
MAVSNIRFVWDPRKARANLTKHGIGFEEAQTVFVDENARIIEDPDSSEAEERFVLLGYSFQARCLAVCHCYRHGDSIVRLISARRATKLEERSYWSFL